MSKVLKILQSSLVILLVAGASSLASAEGLSSASQHFIKNFDANYKKVEANPSLCGGSFDLSLRSEAQALHSSIVRSLSFSQRAAKGVPAAERGHAEIQPRLDKLAKLELCSGVIAKRLEVLKGEEKQVKDRFFAFKKAGSAYHRTIFSLIVFVREPEFAKRSAADATELQRWKSHLEAVHGLCTGEFAGIKNDPRYGNSDDSNPEMWCKAAAMRQQIIERLALNAVHSVVGGMVERLAKVNADFEKNQGYLHIATMLHRALFEPEGLKQELRARFQPVLEVAGLTDSKQIWAELDREVETTWALINKFGPTWKKPTKDGSPGNAAGAAKKYFKSNFKGDSVKSVYLTRASWQFIKNSLGIPLRRTVPGYIIYSHQADAKRAGKLCRGRSFTYAEEYTGRNYAKSTTIKELGYIRFEPCR